jgi:hypothetical protein
MAQESENLQALNVGFGLLAGSHGSIVLVVASVRNVDFSHRNASLF